MQPRCEVAGSGDCQALVQLLVRAFVGVEQGLEEVNRFLGQDENHLLAADSEEIDDRHRVLTAEPTQNSPNSAGVYPGKLMLSHGKFSSLMRPSSILSSTDDRTG